MRFDTIELFLWSRVYADKPSTLEHLKINIHQVMAKVPPNMCQKVIENYLKGINACNTSHIMSTFKLSNKKRNIMKKYFVCILFTFYLQQNG